MNADDAITALSAHIEPGRAEQVAAYMKVDRPYLGVAMPAVNELTTKWRRELSLDERIALADALWKTNIHEAMIAATKLLLQARIRPDTDVWRLIVSWLPDFDAWAIADHAMMAGQKRVVADPSRLDEIEEWTRSDHMWTRRAALVVTLPFTKQNNPKPYEVAARNRILGWAAGYVDDPEWFIQKAVAWWVRDLSKHDPERARAFLVENGARMKPFARKEAAKYL
jgi:3-methyladenine DNA glycosylase AlkD